jgi:outer membrane lipoprotein SlyB
VGGGSVAVAPDPTRSAAGNPNDWAVVGAAITLPTGPDVRDAQPRIGAVGTQEMVARLGANTYEITIRMDDGERKVLQRRDGTLFRVGDRVTVSGGMMEKL